MANTIDVSIGLTYRDSNNVPLLNVPNRKVSQSQTSNVRIQGVQNIGTTYEALALGDVSSDGGAVYLLNRSATNFVEVGLEVAAAFVAFVKLKPGEFAYIAGASDKDLFARANTAAVDLEYIIFAP